MSGSVTAYQLPNTWVLTVPIDALTAAGVMEALPVGDVPTASSDGPTKMEVTIGADAAGLPVMIVHALVDGSVAPDTVYTITLADSAGLKPQPLPFQIIADTVPTSLLGDLNGATHTLQSVPPPG